MSQFMSKAGFVEATQWFENGDHPLDNCKTLVDVAGNAFLSEGKVVRYYRHPSTPGTQTCPHCRTTMHLHGWIDVGEDGLTVCPGDWIITSAVGEYYACPPHIFAAIYEPVL